MPTKLGVLYCGQQSTNVKHLVWSLHIYKKVTSNKIYMSYFTGKGSLLNMWTAMVQASLRIRAVLPKPMLFAHLSQRPMGNFTKGPGMRNERLLLWEVWRACFSWCNSYLHIQVYMFFYIHHIYPKYWDRLAWTNSVDQDQMPQNAASD